LDVEEEITEIVVVDENLCVGTQVPNHKNRQVLWSGLGSTRDGAPPCIYTAVVLGDIRQAINQRHR